LASLLGGLAATQITMAQEQAVIYQIVHNITDPEEMKEEIISGKYKQNCSTT